MKRRDFSAMFGAGLVGAALPAGRAAAFSPPNNDVVPVTVGALANGTAQWELSVIKKMELDKKHGVDLSLKDVSGKQASHVALMSGDVDIVLSDFIWVATVRADGEDFTVVPHSYAVGGLMVQPDGPIQSINDLPGKTIAIAGGPVDKSWVALQAYYNKETGESLADKVEARFGAPPLVNELLAEGKADASLNFWHFNARSKAAGMKELISVTEMMEGLGVTDQPPLLGWVFRESIAAEKPGAIKGFLDASFEAKKMLLNRDSVWNDLKELMRVGDDQTLFETLRADYRKGIIPEYDQAMIDAAAASYKIMAEYGGPELVGDATEMPAGTFWSDYGV
ncbi:ABC transporter substrate-binding protein [Maritimibacter sp. UBA3975]|uniref:ABC transporter substrate-binding protein n=1 Tax=Maritimibacter sp. UBA3975 TaxID=1946833 RepID=UPI000C097320|nr:ABC transporter substrate-binding protein [Maritimibacter sp. UBA3975]MAM61770.1 sulfonate ABC transporter substrate-binding protein [Maritimibacter sp.]|tara:strand:- start:9867 stop:10877 length:1011 start_codon:yes stop_codon:yes gene_type:complete